MSTSPNHEEDVWVESDDGHYEPNIRQLRQMDHSINLTAGFETELGVHHVYRNEKHNGGQFAFTLPSEFEYTKFHTKLKSRRYRICRCTNASRE